MSLILLTYIRMQINVITLNAPKNFVIIVNKKKKINSYKYIILIIFLKANFPNKHRDLCRYVRCDKLKNVHGRCELNKYIRVYTLFLRLLLVQVLSGSISIHTML